MTAKFKVKADGTERLILSGIEMDLVAALLENVRLGQGDPYKSAALNILEALDRSSAYDGFQYKHSAKVDVTIEYSDGNAHTYNTDSIIYDTVIDVHSADKSGPEKCSAECSNFCAEQCAATRDSVVKHKLTQEDAEPSTRPAADEMVVDPFTGTVIRRVDSDGGVRYFMPYIQKQSTPDQTQQVQ
jgi:hypothetical protein